MHLLIAPLLQAIVGLIVWFSMFAVLVLSTLPVLGCAIFSSNL